jgi:Leucine-rich repeat (LRR) protein
MKSLKTLNLANNALSLLPRRINMMTNLQSLNLSRYD